MSTWHVYKYICGCGHWWATTSEDRHCPKCGGDELVSRVYLESEEAAMLTALGAVTAERDEARKKLDNVRECLGVTDEIVWDVMTSWDGGGVQPGPEIVELKKQRDDARRWARHYKRLYEATQKAAPFVTDEVHITRQSKRSKGGSKNGTV